MPARARSRALSSARGRASKRLAHAQVPGPAGLQRAARAERQPRQLEAVVEPDRPELRVVAEAESDRAPQLRHADIGRVREDVAAVDERDDAEILSADPRDAGAQLQVEDDEAVAAERQ